MYFEGAGPRLGRGREKPLLPIGTRHPRSSGFNPEGGIILNSSTGPPSGILRGRQHEDVHSVCGARPDTGLYVGIVPGVPGAHTQGATLDELQENLKEVLKLCLEEFEGSTDDLPRFVGLQQVEVAI